MLNADGQPMNNDTKLKLSNSQPFMCISCANYGINDKQK